MYAFFHVDSFQMIDMLKKKKKKARLASASHREGPSLVSAFVTVPTGSRTLFSLLGNPVLWFTSVSRDGQPLPQERAPHRARQAAASRASQLLTNVCQAEKRGHLA